MKYLHYVVIIISIITLVIRHAGSCEHSNEPLGSIKGGRFLDKLSGY